MEHKKERMRLPHEVRRDQILSTAMILGEKLGILGFTRDFLASEAGVSCGHVNFIFGNITNVKREMIKEAIRCKNLNILGQALSCVSDPDLQRLAMKASNELKHDAISLMLKKES